MSDAPVFPPGTFRQPAPEQPDATSFEDLAKQLKSIEQRLWAVRHALHADQDKPRAMLEEVERDLRRLIVNVGGV